MHVEPNLKLSTFEKVNGSLERQWRSLLDKPRVVSFFCFVASVGVFGYRGWDSRQVLMPLDVVFVQQSLDPSSPFSGINTPFGQFDLLRQFSGYLHSVARLLVELFELAPLTAFSYLTFVTATLIWSFCSWSLFVAVRLVADSTSGFAAAMALCLLPSSNIILLGQLNALQWPLLVASIVLIVTEWRPLSRFSTVAFFTLLFITSASAALAFILLLLIALQFRTLGWARIKWPVTAVAIPYVAQIVAYLRQPGRRAEELNPVSHLIQEMAYIPKVLLPGPLRGAVDERLGMLGVVLLGSILLAFGFLLSATFRSFRRASDPTVRSIASFPVVAVFSGSISVVLNGNLNHQYLMIPLTCFWLTIILCINRLVTVPTMRHWGQMATVIAFAVFVFSGIASWKKGYSDEFFDPPALARLDYSLQEAKEACELNPGSVVDASGTGLKLPCDIVLTLR